MPDREKVNFLKKKKWLVIFKAYYNVTDPVNNFPSKLDMEALDLNFKFKWLAIRSPELNSALGTTRVTFVFPRTLSCLSAASDP